MIQIDQLHHVSLLVRELERSRTFYRDILGLVEMERPAFDFPGAWFRVGHSGQQLHLIVHPGQTLRTGEIDTRDGHFAMRVSSYRSVLETLEQHGIEYKANPVSRAGFAQIFILDPDRNIVEFNADRPES